MTAIRFNAGPSNSCQEILNHAAVFTFLADSFELQNANRQGRNRLRLAVIDLPRTAADRTQKSFNWTVGLQSAAVGFHTRVFRLEIANRICQCQLSDPRSEFERQLDPRESDRNGHTAPSHEWPQPGRLISTAAFWRSSRRGDSQVMIKCRH